MLSEINSVLVSQLNATKAQPLATYEITGSGDKTTYIVYGAITLPNSTTIGYPATRIYEWGSTYTKFDTGFLITTEDPKGGSANLLTALGSVSWG